MTENGTYIRNADFPQALSGDDIDDCSFEINKCADGKSLFKLIHKLIAESYCIWHKSLNCIYSSISEVCSLRLDFHSFDILAGTGFDLAGVVVDSTGACQDTFSVDQNANGAGTPVICGLNTNQHSKTLSSKYSELEGHSMTTWTKRGGGGSVESSAFYLPCKVWGLNFSMM